MPFIYIMCVWLLIGEKWVEVGIKRVLGKESWTWIHIFYRTGTYLVLFLKFVFSWRTIALQCCVGFCHTSTWLSYRYTFVPSLLSLPSTSYCIPPISVVTECREINQNFLPILPMSVYLLLSIYIQIEYLSHFSILSPLQIKKKETFFLIFWNTVLNQLKTIKIFVSFF